MTHRVFDVVKDPTHICSSLISVTHNPEVWWICGSPDVVGGPSIVSGQYLCALHWLEERKVSWLLRKRMDKERRHVK